MTTYEHNYSKKFVYAYTDIHSTSHTMYDARERGGKMRRRKDRKNDAEERGRVI